MDLPACSTRCDADPPFSWTRTRCIHGDTQSGSRISRLPPTSQPDVAGAASRQAAGDVDSPISNEAYNVITALESKLEGLEPCRKYSNDGGQQIWNEMSNHDNDQ